MMRGMEVAACAILIAAFAWSGPSAEPLGPPIEDLRALRTDGFAEVADAVVLYSGVAITLEPDGRITRRVRLVRRFLTDRSIAYLGDPRIAYDTSRQELEIEVNRTFMLDGTEVNAKPHAFNEVAPERLASCPDRMKVQEMVVSLVGLERGCLTELLYAVRDTLPWRPWLDGIETVGGEAPVLSAEIRIEVPQPQALRHATLHMQAEPELLGPGLFVWKMGPLPAFPREGGIDHASILPALVYSTCPSWDDAGSWIRSRLSAAASPDSAIASWTEASMLGGRPPIDDRDRIRRAVLLLSERTIAAEDSPWTLWGEPRPAARTFETSCGNLLDRAALGWAVLRQWGIEAVPLLARREAFVREVPGLSQVDDIWLRVPFGDIAVGSGRFGEAIPPDEGAELLLLGPQGSQLLSGAPRTSTCRLKARLREKEDGSVDGQVALRVGGAACRGLDASDLKRFLDDLAASVCRAAEIASYQINRLGPDSLDCLLSIQGPSLGESIGGDRRRLALPTLSGIERSAWPANLDLNRQKRATPIRLPGLIFEETELRLEPLSASRVLIAPGETNRQGAGASVAVQVDRDGEAWIFRRIFRTTRREIEAADYPEFKPVLLERAGVRSAAIYLGRRGQ